MVSMLGLLVASALATPWMDIQVDGKDGEVVKMQLPYAWVADMEIDEVDALDPEVVKKKVAELKPGETFELMQATTDEGVVNIKLSDRKPAKAKATQLYVTVTGENPVELKLPIEMGGMIAAMGVDLDGMEKAMAKMGDVGPFVLIDVKKEGETVRIETK